MVGDGRNATDGIGGAIVSVGMATVGGGGGGLAAVLVGADARGAN
jgi:hypothetical protein